MHPDTPLPDLARELGVGSDTLRAWLRRNARDTTRPVARRQGGRLLLSQILFRAAERRRALGAEIGENATFRNMKIRPSRLTPVSYLGMIETEKGDRMARQAQMVSTIKLGEGLLGRADRVAEVMNRDERATRHGVVTRSRVMREAIAIGLAALETQYSVPVVDTAA